MSETPPPRTVFVSHAHADNELCDRYVAALRERGLDVWYDRTNLQAGHSLSSDIEAELRRRSAFVVLATPASLASQWVRSEIAAFRSLAAQDPTRLFLPVRAAACEMPLLWVDILWIDAVSLGFDAAVDTMAVALGAASAPTVEAAPTPQPAWMIADELDKKRAEELNKKGDALYRLGRYEEALLAYNKAVALDKYNYIIWSNRASALNRLGRFAQLKWTERRAWQLGYKP